MFSRNTPEVFRLSQMWYTLSPLPGSWYFHTSFWQTPVLRSGFSTACFAALLQTFAFCKHPPPPSIIRKHKTGRNLLMTLWYCKSYVFYPGRLVQRRQPAQGKDTCCQSVASAATFLGLFLDSDAVVFLCFHWLISTKIALCNPKIILWSMNFLYFVKKKFTTIIKVPNYTHLRKKAYKRP